jgi:2',5'-phosphodiesterase
LPDNTAVNLRRGDLWTNPNRRKQSSDDSSLRVVTYNILADQNAYERSRSSSRSIPCRPYVTLETLDKARRMPLILHELLTYQADVLCLQEVDESIWNRLFQPALEQAGYQGYFSCKVSKGTSEGCAIAWSLHRFDTIPMEEMKHYGLCQLVRQSVAGSSKEDNPWKSAATIARLLQDNRELQDVVSSRLGHIVQMVSLPLKRKNPCSDEEPARVLVANTHLFFNPSAAHIRLIQMYVICQQFDRFQQQAKGPMILCGDLNSSLKRAAGYLLVHREVLSTHSQIREHFNTFRWKDDRNVATVGGNQSALSVSAASMRVEKTEAEQAEAQSHWVDFPDIKLPDHFATFLPGYLTEPEFSHYLDVFVGSLDHIFVSQSSGDNPHGLIPFREAPMPSVEDATDQVAMPSEKFPSDHISLVVDLKFTKDH